MPDLKISDLTAMQAALQSRMKDVWLPTIPENGHFPLLWMYEEMGEAVAIIKKRGSHDIMHDETVRAAFIEELADVLVYFAGLMNSYGITAGALSQAFIAKHEKNMHRDFIGEHKAYLAKDGGDASLAATPCPPNPVKNSPLPDLKISELLAMQGALQNRMKGKWLPTIPENGHFPLLWMFEEAGEAVAIIKKRGSGDIMHDETVRAAFIEELADVLMYFADVMTFYGISAEALSASFTAKHERNMQRDFVGEHKAYLAPAK